MTERKMWVDAMMKIAMPVLEALSAGELREKMPVYARPAYFKKYDGGSDRANYTYLEALGRTVCGIAPWLSHTVEDAEEEAARDPEYVRKNTMY